MNSLDTNILLYAANSDAPEHAKALGVVNMMIANPSEWILSDQVLWELYNGLRHPKILKHPRTPAQAAAHVRFIREQSGVACCAYETGYFGEILSLLEKPRFPYRRVHDSVLGITLLRGGVKTFYTRNQKDFTDVPFLKVVNPID